MSIANDSLDNSKRNADFLISILIQSKDMNTGNCLICEYSYTAQGTLKEYGILVQYSHTQ